MNSQEIDKEVVKVQVESLRRKLLDFSKRNDLLNHTISEVKKKENMTRLQVDILDPIITYAFRHMYPYIIITSLIFFLTFIVAVAILIFLLRGYTNIR